MCETILCLANQSNPIFGHKNIYSGDESNYVKSLQDLNISSVQLDIFHLLLVIVVVVVLFHLSPEMANTSMNLLINIKEVTKTLFDSYE